MNKSTRSLKNVKDAYDQLSERLWWNRHKMLVRRVEAGKVKHNEGETKFYESAKEHARKMEEKYGAENLHLSPEETLLEYGRLSALEWMLGIDWDDTLAAL